MGGRRTGQLSNVPRQMQGETPCHRRYHGSHEQGRRNDRNQQGALDPRRRRRIRAGAKNDRADGALRTICPDRSNPFDQIRIEYGSKEGDRAVRGDDGACKFEHLEAVASELFGHLRASALWGHVLAQGIQCKPTTDFLDGSPGLRPDDDGERNDVVRRWLDIFVCNVRIRSHDRRPFPAPRHLMEMFRAADYRSCVAWIEKKI
jgi:hypothetical protein